MMTTTDYFYRANPDKLDRINKLKKLMSLLDCNYDQLVNRLCNNWSDKLYTRVNDAWTTLVKIKQEIKNINSACDHFSNKMVGII